MTGPGKQWVFFLDGPRCSFRSRPHVSGYFRIRNFFFPDTATVRAHSANSTANPEKKNPLSRVEKNISATNRITCGRVNLEIFFKRNKKDLRPHLSFSPVHTTTIIKREATWNRLFAILDTHGQVGWRPVVSIWMTSPFSDGIVVTVHTRKR